MELRENIPVRRGKDTPAKVASYLRDHPGKWGRWPVEQRRESVYKQTNNINHDRVRALPAKEFQARSWDGSTWVCYTPNGRDDHTESLDNGSTHQRPNVVAVPGSDIDPDDLQDGLGEPGDKVADLHGVITMVNDEQMTRFGKSHLIAIQLDDGPTVTFFGNGKTLLNRHEGERVEITSAKVKAHVSWNGEPQVQLSSVKLA